MLNLYNYRLIFFKAPDTCCHSPLHGSAHLKILSFAFQAYKTHKKKFVENHFYIIYNIKKIKS